LFACGSRRERIDSVEAFVKLDHECGNLRGGLVQGGIHAAEIVMILLLVFVAAFAALASKLKTPYPIVLVVAGLILSVVPGIPSVRLDPNIVFVVVLPPLLYSAAWRTSWRDFYYNLVSILLLAFGLVGFTVLGVAFIAHLVFPGFDWRLGVVLGAVVAPTDSIAATSIAKKIGLPRRIVDVLEGESLVNDATGLLALEFGIALVISGDLPTLTAGFFRLGYLVVVGLGIGLVVAFVVNWFERRIDDSRIEITISILVPYAAYLAAESVHASGVLAVVACGLYLGRRSATFFSAGVRMQVTAVWNALTFILNGLVFVLIGLQMHHVVIGIRGFGMARLILFGVLFSALVIVLRLLWTFPGAQFAYFVRSRLLGQTSEKPSMSQIFVVGWTGMRGVIALAAAISLPEVLTDGSPFPQRNIIIFLTFSVILVTLVVQGLTLPAVIRGLGLAAEGRTNEEDHARHLMLQAALDYLERQREKNNDEFAEIYDDLVGHYQHQLASLGGDGHDETSEIYSRFLEVSRDLLGVEREKIISLRDEGRISDEVLRRLETELDLNEARLLLASSGQADE
jgi:monovalent cation/hydrogen antiporter